MKVYKSKIDLWLMVVCFAPFLFGIVESILDEEYIALAILLALTVVMGALFGKTEYTIDGSMLYIKAAYIVCQKIKIAEIKSVEKTSNPLSAPALSMKRLEIKYGNNFDYALISPKQRQEFIDNLLAVNPSISLKL